MAVCQNDVCAAEFTPKRRTTGKYCSRSCAAVVNNSLHPKRSRSRSPRPYLAASQSRQCALIGCEGRVSRNFEFCNSTCYAAYKRLELIARWKAGDGSVATCRYRGLQRWAREYLVAEAGACCSKCGWGELHPDDGRPLVQVDHEDGDASNNHIWNLRVLCPNCHAMTPTYGARNPKSSRVRYA